MSEPPQNAGPFVPTPWKIVHEMIALAAPTANDFIVELGSGDGRLLITAAQRTGASGLGVDLNPDLVKLANENARHLGMSDRVRFEQGDLFCADLSTATVLFLYLLPGVEQRLVPKMLAEMKAGARVISHDYPLMPLIPERHLEFEVEEKIRINGTARTVLYIYSIPDR